MISKTYDWRRNRLNMSWHTGQLKRFQFKSNSTKSATKSCLVHLQESVKTLMMAIFEIFHNLNGFDAHRRFLKHAT